jgi:hypothetical protein
MRRVLVGVLLALAVGGLTGCPAQPPAGYRSPTVVAVTVSPEAPQPGDVVTITAVLADDEYLFVGFETLLTPRNIELPGGGDCTDVFEAAEDRRTGVLTLTCNIPAYASSGTWQAEVTVWDTRPPLTDYPFQFGGVTTFRLPFEVTGGSDDVTGPTRLNYTTSPTELHTDSAFTLSVTLEDQASPPAVDYGRGLLNSPNTAFVFAKPWSDSRFVCTDATYTPVSDTVTTVDLACERLDAGTPQLGDHLAQITFRDALGNPRTSDYAITIT